MNANFRCFLFPSRRGAIMIMSALSLVVLLSFVALVTDIGFLYFQKARAETAASAGWKAGQDLASVSAVDNDGLLTTQAQAAIANRVRDVIFQTYGITEAVPGLTWSVAYENNIAIRQNLRVNVSFNANLFFAAAIGINNRTVAAFRGAPFETGGEGVIPIGVPHGKLRQAETHSFTFDKFEDDEGFIPGEEYIIRLGNVKGTGGSGDDEACTVCGGTGSVTTGGTSCAICGGDGYVQPPCTFCGGDGVKDNGRPCNKCAPVACTNCGGDGSVGGSTTSCTTCGGDGIVSGGGALPGLRSASNHGSLDMGSKGGGARDYEEFFKFGYPGPVAVGDLLYVKPGTMKGPNDDGRDYRVADPSRRRVVVPIVKCPDPSEDDIVPQEKNGSKDQVEVIGFAIFDLLQVNEYSQAPLPDGLGSYDPVRNKDSDQVRGIFVGYLVKPS